MKNLNQYILLSNEKISSIDDYISMINEKISSIDDYINEKLILSKTGYKHTEDEYFYHEALEDGYIIEFTNTYNVLQYSIDNCKTWNDLNHDTETPEINKGERIYFKGENLEVSDVYGIGIFDSNKKFNVGGNIMSLIYGDDFNGQTKLLNNNQFKCLFLENEYLLSCENLLLPATKLTNGCYFSMFDGCKSLKQAPELPATTLNYNCYRTMFYDCVSLNEITMLATNITVKHCLHCWVNNISKTGTFIKAKDVNIPEGRGGIPKGWTVKEI